MQIRRCVCVRACVLKFRICTYAGMPLTVVKLMQYHLSMQQPCISVLLIWMTVGQGPTALAVGTGGLVGCFGFNGPLRQYFSLYRAVSQRE